MSTISELKASRYKENQEKKHNYEMKKLRSQHQSLFSKQVKTNEAQIDQITAKYNNEIKNLKNNLEHKLITMRAKQKLNIKEENSRLKEEVYNLRLAHDDQVEELKNTQKSEIERMTFSQRETLDAANDKFNAEKIKLESYS